MNTRSKRDTAFTATEIVCSLVRRGVWLFKRGHQTRRAASLVHSKGVTKSPRLFAEDENTGLARKTDFPYLAIFPDQDGVISGLGAAVFPPSFGFGNDLLAVLHAGFVSLNFHTVLSGSHIGFAEFCGLRNVDGLGEGLRKSRHCQCDGGQQSHAADK